jgi:hypothetical protein
MAEVDLYEPVKQCLEGSLAALGKRCCLEVAAKRGFSETAKQAIPQGKLYELRTVERAEAGRGAIS